MLTTQKMQRMTSLSMNYVPILHHIRCICQYTSSDVLYYNMVICVKNWNVIIRELREDHDLNQSDVAKVLGTTQQVYSRYENGINELPLRHLITLCGFYHVSADYILGLEN